MREPPTIRQLVELEAWLMAADDRSIRWIYDRWNGVKGFEADLQTAASTETIIRFFENEEDILKQMDQDELEDDFGV